MTRLFHDPAPSRLRHVELAYVTEPETPVTPEPDRPATSSGALAIEDDLIRTILEPLPLLEPAAKGFARKEAILLAMLDGLSANDRLALHARLSEPVTQDALVAAFGRLSLERRARLLELLSRKHERPRR